MGSRNDAEHSGAVRESQSVTPEGVPVRRQIEGLIIRPLRTQVDRRGELVEIYNPAWKVHPAPMVFAYQATIRPKAIKGWVVHKDQDDRILRFLGVMCWEFSEDS